MTKIIRKLDWHTGRYYYVLLHILWDDVDKPSRFAVHGDTCVRYNLFIGSLRVSIRYRSDIITYNCNEGGARGKRIDSISVPVLRKIHVHGLIGVGTPGWYAKFEGSSFANNFCWNIVGCITLIIIKHENGKFVGNENFQVTYKWDFYILIF